MRHSTDDDWEELGRLDPYWAVISDRAYSGERLSDGELARFLKTGEDHVEALWHTCRNLFSDFAPHDVLDFGCGVGRVTLALARRATSVVGADVAESMLRLARTHVDAAGLTNVRLVKTDDRLSSIGGPFDLVHSVLVLQHVPTGRGLTLIERLIDFAGDRGVVLLHVLYHNPFERPQPVRRVRRVARTILRKPRPVPEIEMNPYPLNTVFRIIQRAGVERVSSQLTDHGGHLGMLLLFRKGSG
jgi:ubiquinone/menaquinone biosynthesis C-methylase UbiE